MALLSRKLVARAAEMAEYRVCIIGPDGGFSRAIQLLCRDDDAAKEYARQFVDGHDVELWRGDRKIQAFTHTTR